MRALSLALLLIACKGGTDTSDPGLTDADGDGRSPNAGDCDDTDASIGPDADEIWYDGIDQNCDGNDDDQDEDGVTIDTDCDDEDPNVAPGAVDTFGDGIDADCDASDAGAFERVAEGARSNTIGPALQRVPDLAAFWIEHDGDSVSGVVSARVFDDDMEVDASDSIQQNAAAGSGIGWDEPLVALEDFGGTYSWASGAMVSGNQGAYTGGIVDEFGEFWARMSVMEVDHIAADRDGDDFLIAYCGPSASRMWTGNANELGNLDGEVLHFNPNGSSTACQPINEHLYLLNAGSVTENLWAPEGGEVAPTARTFAGTYIDVLASDDVLVLVHATGAEIYEGATPIEVDLADTTRVAVSRQSATNWAIATADAAGAVTLYVGDPAGTMVAEPLPDATAIDRLDVAINGDGVVVSCRNGLDAWVSGSAL